MNKKVILLGLIIVSCLLFPSESLVIGQPDKRKSPANNKFETRCGWFENPTPANVWLNDKDGEWIISIQGGYQAEGDAPEFPAKQWVLTNAGSYGYGCACLQVKVNRRTRQILQIKSGVARPLEACRKDRRLKEPKE